MGAAVTVPPAAAAQSPIPPFDWLDVIGLIAPKCRLLLSSLVADCRECLPLLSESQWLFFPELSHVRFSLSPLQAFLLLLFPFIH